MPCCPGAVFLSTIASLAIADITAQCAIAPASAQGCSGVVGGISTIRVWDPDGAGPAPGQLVVAGSFAVAGTVAANSVVTWDLVGQSWSPPGTGLTAFGSPGHVASVVTMSNGDLVVVGSFADAGGVAANGIATWNGQSWSSLGPGLYVSTSGGVQAAATLPNGDLIVGGQLQVQPPSPWSGTARWNGASWFAMPGLTGQVYCLAVLPNGDIVAAGKIGLNGAATHTESIARWDGVSWSGLATGLNGPVNSIWALPNGGFVAGGSFTTIAGIPVNYVARWNGGWSSMSGGMNALVTSFATLPTGDLVAGGHFTIAGGVVANRVARWTGAAWAPIGTGCNWRVGSLAVLPNGDLVAGRGGGWILAGSGESNDAIAEIARWDGSTWSLLTPGGVTDFVEAAVIAPNGDLVIGGRFTQIAGVPANRVARWNGTSWFPLGSGMDDRVFRLLSRPNGDIVAAGLFTAAGGVPANNLARWDGTAWSPLGGTYQWGRALIVGPNGDLLAATTTAPFLERWDGIAWSPFVTGTTSTVTTMVYAPNGDLWLAHSVPPSWFPPTAPWATIERWDGTSLSSMGTANGACGIGIWPDGDVYARGTFSMIGTVAAPGLARWSGSAWAAIPLLATNGGVYDYAMLPNGDLVAGGSFTMAGGVPANNVARWNGTSWSAIGSGANGFINSLITLPNGDLLASGAFTVVDQRVSPYLARLTTTCPASASSYGVGCTSSSGSNKLTATTLPWVDLTFRARGTGLPILAFVIAATSFTPIAQGAVPLAATFAQAPTGCDLLVYPDILQLYATGTGSIESSLFLPDTPPLVGLSFYHQLIPAEVDAVGNIVQITATNALRLTVGMF